MAISYIASGTGITSVSSMPSHAAGDYLIGCAFRDGNNTAPTLPAGWTELPSGSSLGAGSNSNGMRLAYKVASSSSEVSGTWTSATSLNIDVYRGVGSVGNVTQNEGNGVNINYPANTFTVTDGTSWGVLYGAHRSANTDIEVPPTGATNRSDNADATDELATHDTNGGVTSWSSTNQTLTGTSSGWRTVVVELVAASSAVTGTIGQTLPKLSQSVTASRAFDASVAQTLPKLTQSATASRAFHATIGQTLPKLAQSVSASLTFAATAAQTLPKLAQAASASLTYTATAAQTLPRLAQSVSASLTFSGSIAQALPRISQLGTASLGLAASIGQTLPAISQSASASLTFSATSAQSLPKLNQAISASVSDIFAASIDQTLPSLTQNGAAAVTYSATTAQALPKLAQNLTSALTFTAATAQVLPGVNQSVAASFGYLGVVAQTFPTLAQSLESLVLELPPPSVNIDKSRPRYRRYIYSSAARTYRVDSNLREYLGADRPRIYGTKSVGREWKD